MAAHKAIPAASWITTVTATDGTTVATVEAIAPVGAELSYDPQLHQLLGRAQPGERVKVRYTGYCQATSCFTEPR